MLKSADLLAIGRFGVGYDSVDVEACTAADVAVIITAGAVDRSVAEATVGWMIALGHRAGKDQLVRDGRWDQRSRYMGFELRDRVLGVIGLGGIVRATIELLRPFGAADDAGCWSRRSRQAAAGRTIGLAGRGRCGPPISFRSIAVRSTFQTRGLIGRREIALMKTVGFLINTARGGIVDEDALHSALESVADCRAPRSLVSRTSRCAAFTDLEPWTNVLLPHHSIAWTHELFRDIGRAACQSMLDLSLGISARRES